MHTSVKRAPGRRAIAAVGGTWGPTCADALALAPLAARSGASVEAVAWDSARVDRSRNDAVLIRSTRDCHLRLDAFLGRAERPPHALPGQAVAAAARRVHGTGGVPS